MSCKVLYVVGANEGSEPIFKAPVFVSMRTVSGVALDMAYEEPQKLDRAGEVKTPVCLGAFFKKTVTIGSKGFQHRNNAYVLSYSH